MSENVYGIDLGTTYSCLAGFNEDGKIVVFENDQMETTTPSVVWFNGLRGRTATVGAAAKEQAAVSPEAVVSCIKRKMGTSEETMQGGQKLLPEMVSALILKKLVKDAKIKEKKPKVVITCPAYFGDSGRQATKIAGELAGLEVLSIINEPSAAAFSYGMEQNDLKGKDVLVFDLGGGTFDATVLRIGEDIRVIATGGDGYLGGRDWDEAIAHLFIERFCDATGYDRGKAENDAGFLAEMVVLAEKRKRQLTRAQKVKVAIEKYGRTCSFEFTRDEFDAQTAGSLESAISATKTVLEEARMKDRSFRPEDMEILMVGGSTLMPQVAVALERAFGIVPKSYKPHEAVARGAALYARQAQEIEKVKARHGNPDDLFLGGEVRDNLFLGGDVRGDARGAGEGQGKFKRIRNVTSKSYGVRYYDSQTDRQGYVVNVIPKNTEIPFKPEMGGEVGESHSWTLFPNQTEVLFEVYENEDMSLRKRLDLDYCNRLGAMTLTGLPGGRPAGQACTIFMELSDEGLLHAWGIHDETGKRCDVTIQTEGVLSEEEIEDSQAIVDSFKVE